MPQSSGRIPRLFVDADLTAGAEYAATPEHAHYLVNVLRRAVGDPVHVFNGRDGEWEATLAATSKKRANLVIAQQLRAQTRSGVVISAPDYLFAPIKRARLDYMVQKATELGAGRLRPVITQFTQAERLNLDRLRANAVEAAEQSGGLTVPEVHAPVPLERVLAGWDDTDNGRALVFCDEAAPVADPIEVLRTIPREKPVAVLIGPEGGFSADERKRLQAHPATLAISLGPRILRADTAAVAALTLVGAVHGRWC